MTRPAAQGENNHRAKVTVQDVLDMRARRKHTPLKVLAAEYGLSVSAVHQIVTRETWRHVP